MLHVPFSLFCKPCSGPHQANRDELPAAELTQPWFGMWTPPPLTQERLRPYYGMTYTPSRFAPADASIDQPPYYVVAQRNTGTNSAEEVVRLTLPFTGHWAVAGKVTGSFQCYQHDGGPGFTLSSNFDGQNASCGWGSDQNNSGSANCNGGWYAQATWGAGTALVINMDGGWHINSRNLTGTIYGRFVPMQSIAH